MKGDVCMDFLMFLIVFFYFVTFCAWLFCYFEFQKGINLTQKIIRSVFWFIDIFIRLSYQKKRCQFCKYKTNNRCVLNGRFINNHKSCKKFEKK